jgi:hypothetical protein
MNSDKIAHLGFIQVIIARMGANSFFLKGWSITLIGAMFALSADKSNTKFIYIAYVASFLFWLMDAYFLRQEKLFRELYNRVADGTILSDRFTLTTGGYNSEVLRQRS